MHAQKEASSVYAMHDGTGGPPSPVTPEEDTPPEDAVPDEPPEEAPDEPPEELPLDDAAPEEPEETPEELPEEPPGEAPEDPPPDELLDDPEPFDPAHAAMLQATAAATTAWRTPGPLARRPIADLVDRRLVTSRFSGRQPGARLRGQVTQRANYGVGFAGHDV
jgi:hypothetical protein